MFLKYRTKAFILKKDSRGEADQVIYGYSRDYGKIRVLVKGARRLNSKLRGGVQVLNLVEIEFISGKAGRILTDAVSLENFPDIKKDLLKLRLALRFCRVLSFLTKEGDRDERIWGWLKNFFFGLQSEELSLKKAVLFYHFFLWNFLKLLGYQPILDKRIPSSVAEVSRLIFAQDLCQLLKKGKDDRKTLDYLKMISKQYFELASIN